MISIDTFRQVELRIAQILEAERIEGSDKLLKLQIDCGGDRRQIVSGIAKAYAPEDLLGKEVVIIANLEPRMFSLSRPEGTLELKSEGMLLAASGENGKPVLLMPEREVAPGSSIT